MYNNQADTISANNTNLITTKYTSRGINNILIVHARSYIRDARSLEIHSHQSQTAKSLVILKHSSQQHMLTVYAGARSVFGAIAISVANDVNAVRLIAHNFA